MFLPLFRAPHGWRIQNDGSLVNAYETEEYRQAVAFCRQLREGGSYHPNAATMTFEEEESALLGGEISLQIQGYATWLGPDGLRGRIRDLNPAADLRGVIMPGFDGGQPVTFNEPGYYGFTAISAQAGKDESRVEELLRIMNYLLAPFGSEEQIFLEFGVEGVHHTVEDSGGRVLTEAGRLQIGLVGYTPLVWVARPEPQVFYYPTIEGEAAYAQDLAVQVLSVGIDNPTFGLFSATNSDKSGELGQLQSDRIGAIIAGRDDLSAFDDFVSEWRSRGGDQIRAEYEQQLADQS